MESEALRAFCPECQAEYDFYVDPSAAPGASPADPALRASDGRLARRCFACSFRTSRWDVLWIPAFFVVVASFPLLWMIWSNLIGPVLFVFGAALPFYRRAQQRKLAAKTCASAAAP